MNKLSRKTRLRKRSTLKHKTLNTKKLKQLALAILITLIAATLYIVYLRPHTLEEHQKHELEHTVQQLKNTRTDLQRQKSVDEQQDAAKAKQIEELNKQIQEKDKQLEAKRAAQTAYAATLQAQTPVYTAPAPAASTSPVSGCGDNSYAHYIYMHESGCVTDKYNSIGCYGIGQSCPASKIASCGADYACQNAWFTAYAKKYCYLGTGLGCWEGSYNFWLANQWW